MKAWCAIVFVVATSCTTSAAGGPVAHVTFPDTVGFPRVVLTPEEVIDVRARSWQPWAQPIRQRILDAADALVTESLGIPHEEGQWTHWYSCAADAAALTPLDPNRHMCPICGTIYTGYPYDAVYVSMRHNHWLGGVRTLGLAYALRPERRYAARVRDILLEYASFYTDLRLHNRDDRNTSSKARLFAQTLDEAVALCDVVTGFDLVYDSPAFSRADHGIINRQLIRQMVKTIQGNDAGISNWQSWHNAAVGLAGCLLRDDRLVEWALYGKSGFEYQLRRSLMATGMWYEESPVYHWYALRAHVQLLEAAWRAGIPLYEHPKVRGMFEAPLRIVLPDGTLPPLNDSDRVPIALQSGFYDIASRRYGGSVFAQRAMPRDSDYALLWGAADLALSSPESSAHSTNSPSEGLAVLRNDENSVVAMLEYGPGLSGHVQPAKLNLILYGLGDLILVDPGRISYGNNLQKEWYTQTLAHNTVVINQTSQTRTRGSLRAFSDNPAVVRAVCSTAYPNVVLDRTILLHENLLFDIVRCESKRPAVIDLPFHIKATVKEFAPAIAAPALGQSAGYQHMHDVQQLDPEPRMMTFVAPSGQEVRVHLAPTDAVFTATAPGNPPTERVPLVLRRIEAGAAIFATVFEIQDDRFPPRSGAVTVIETGALWGIDFEGVRVTAGRETVVEMGGQRWVIGHTGAVPSLD